MTAQRHSQEEVFTGECAYFGETCLNMLYQCTRKQTCVYVSILLAFIYTTTAIRVTGPEHNQRVGSFSHKCMWHTLCLVVFFLGQQVPSVYSRQSLAQLDVRSVQRLTILKFN